MARVPLGLGVVPLFVLRPPLLDWLHGIFLAEHHRLDVLKLNHQSSYNLFQAALELGQCHVALLVLHVVELLNRVLKDHSEALLHGLYGLVFALVFHQEEVMVILVLGLISLDFAV